MVPVLELAPDAWAATLNVMFEPLTFTFVIQEVLDVAVRDTPDTGFVMLKVAVWDPPAFATLTGLEDVMLITGPVAGVVPPSAIYNASGF